MFRLLTLLLEDMDPHEGEVCQSCGDVIAGRPSGFVFIEHDEDLAATVGVFVNQLSVPRRSRSGRIALERLSPWSRLDDGIREHRLTP